MVTEATKAVSDGVDCFRMRVLCFFCMGFLPMGVGLEEVPSEAPLARQLPS